MKPLAISVDKPSNIFYSDCLTRITDPHGNQRTIATHVEDVKPEELERRLAALGEG